MQLLPLYHAPVTATAHRCHSQAEQQSSSSRVPDAPDAESLEYLLHTLPIMSDNSKRLSLGARVATPRLGNLPGSLMSTDGAIARSVGAKYVSMRAAHTTEPPR